MSIRTDPRTLAPVLILAASLACSHGPSDPATRGPGGSPAGAVVVDGVEYSATVEIMESFPVQLAATVTITNRTDEPKTVTFPDGCVALLRAYQGDTLVWDQAEDVGCTEALVPIELGPGESEQVRSPTSSAADVLDDEWPDGEYAMAVYLRPDGEEVEVDGGTADLAVPR